MASKIWRSVLLSKLMWWSAAPGATPRQRAWETEPLPGGVAGTLDQFVPSPTTLPAVCVPWPPLSEVSAPGSVVIAVLCRSGCETSMPLS